MPIPLNLIGEIGDEDGKLYLRHLWCSVRRIRGPPEHCLICEDERQYIGKDGQRWTTLSEMQKSYQNRIEEVDPNITGIGTTPGFAIGQRGVARPNPKRKCAVGLRQPDRRCHAWKRSVPAVGSGRLPFHIRIRSGLWSNLVMPLTTLPSTGMPTTVSGQCAPIPLFVFWEGETCRVMGGADAGPLRRSFRWLGRAALVRGRGRQGALLTGDTMQVAQDRQLRQLYV